MAFRNDLSTRELRALLLGACGLAHGGCGGIAVFDDGQGGAGSTGSSTVTTTRAASNTATQTTQASTGTGACHPPAEAIEVCLPAVGLCPPATAPIHEELAKVLETIPCEEPELCSCDWTVNQIFCASPQIGCCYAVAARLERYCEGLPFVVAGASRFAELAPGDAWRSRDALVLDAARTGALSLDERRAVAAQYRDDALAEHASVASFARLVLSLLAMGAPAELVASAQRALGDEIRHASICFDIARAFDGQDAGPGPLDVRGALDDRLDVEGFVTAVVREGCIEETLSALAAARARDLATEPAIAAALASIARDEAEHAALSYRVLAFMIAHHGDVASAAARRAFAAGLAAHEAALLGPTPANTEDERRFGSYGRLGAGDRHAATQDALREVIGPTAEALLASITGSSEARGASRTSDRGAERSI